MADVEQWTLSRIALVEQARDSAATSARRAQEAAGTVDGVIDDVNAVKQEVIDRQAAIEAAIADNIPEHDWDGTELRLRNPDGNWGDFVDLKGATGDDGWSPTFSVVADSARLVLRVEDWFGGEGAKPATGLYVGAAGLVATAAEAVDIRGDAGEISSLTVGIVTTGAAGSSVSISISGTAPNQILNFTIPRGDTGAAGSNGADGVGISSATINGSNHLILTKTDTSTVDAGAIYTGVVLTTDIGTTVAAESSVAMVKLASTAMSGLSSADFSLPTGYAYFVLVGYGLSASTISVNCTLSDSTNGTTFNSAGTIVAAPASASAYFSFDLRVVGARTPGNAIYAGNAISVNTKTSVSLSNNSAIIALRVAMSGGTFDAGTIALYGVKA